MLDYILDILIDFSPARLIRILLGNNIDDSDYGFFMKLIWRSLDILSWALIGYLLMLLVQYLFK